MSVVEDHLVSFSLEVNVSPSTTRTLREAHMLLYRTAGLLRRMGLPEDIDRAIGKMQRGIMVANQFRLAVLALQAAMVPGAGWIAGLTALVGIGTFAFSTGDFIAEVYSD